MSNSAHILIDCIKDTYNDIRQLNIAKRNLVLGNRAVYTQDLVHNYDIAIDSLMIVLNKLHIQLSQLIVSDNNEVVLIPNELHNSYRLLYQSVQSGDDLSDLQRIVKEIENLIGDKDAD